MLIKQNRVAQLWEVNGLYFVLYSWSADRFETLQQALDCFNSIGKGK